MLRSGDCSHAIRMDRFSERVSALSGAAADWEVHSSVVWWDSGRVGHVPAVFSGLAAARLRLCALAVEPVESARPGGVHLVLLAASLALMGFLALKWTAAIFPDSPWKPADSNAPIGDAVAILAAAVGFPYFLLSATSPLLQRWFSHVDAPFSPYRLYALSNAGSLLALLSYPVLVEPLMALRTQAHVWTAGYVLFAIGGARCIQHLVSAPRTRPAPPENPGGAASVPHAGPRREYLLWLLLPTCSSMMLVAGTNQICQEVAVVPFLWVLPLTLYLVSFIICFAGETWYSRRVFLPLLTAATALLCWMLPKAIELTIVAQAGAYLLILFAGCTVCHGELVRIKPEAWRLTSFYLTLAAGGAAGGLLVALLAPALFEM